MFYDAFITIFPKEEILDPQGKATLHGLHTLGFQTVDKVRVGKIVRLTIAAADAAAAQKQAEAAAQQLLANPIVEYFRVEVQAARAFCPACLPGQSSPL